ncbi:hypothetical protein PGUG_01299 [Meyerozyma guilliermondii ATCC 6260]|uniref:DNA replication regulator Sld3 C-terminal domain-containing protein n=1 Tax=Meyerozyma guilliermondii (strain ATCC 6260 / CBS 566 / DSM 6381 / JCM 1539 / NBRC 10279 / NRRL Y-324) TaxID=294746 RepID=A5DDE8_PICGU|nr:uncharacterized protein PGUG_01299 [Meyerozyma guilliermondii ATCC 6260]EDK37201.2 hypothetical protein PGUG_01299 [Meyerozyma guilliermondii ATCC 6260]
MDNTGNTERIPTLPYSFTILHSSNSKLQISRHVTISHVFSNIRLERVPSDWFRSPILFTISPDSSLELGEWSGKYWLVKTRADPNDRDYERGLVYHISANLLGMIYLERTVNYSRIFCENKSLPVSAGTVEECIQKWSIDVPKKDSIQQSFSMAPPIISPMSEPHDTAQLETDPLGFIYMKYYSALYSLNTPLSYFPKMALSRFKVLCAKNNDTAREYLLKLILSNEAFHQRHGGPHGLIRNVAFSSNSVIEETYKDKLWDSQPEISQFKNNDEESNAADSDLDQIRAIASALKVREAHLQILLIFEILDYGSVHEESLLASNKEQQELILRPQQIIKKSLVRKRKTKKKVVPTFLGMGVTLDEEIKATPTSPSTNTVNEKNLIAILDTLIENLTLWDTLEESTKGKKKESSLGFFAYVLVPYFNKRLPEITKYVIEKIKPHEKSRGRSRSVSSEPAKGQVPSGQESSRSNRSTRFQKVHLDPQKNPNLKRSNISLASSEDLLPAMSLKRSKSNLSSKNLQRRQVDMSFPKPEGGKEKRKKLNRSQSLYDPPTSTESIFGNAKKATRSFAADLGTIISTPVKEKVSQISETPSTSHHVSNGHEVVVTPEERFVLPTVTSVKSSGMRNLSDKLYAAANIAEPNDIHSTYTSPVNSQQAIVSSVERNHIEETPKDGLIISSPQKSSTKRKPGEPVSIQESPFFHTSLNGSPTSSNQRTGVFGKIARRKR